MKTQQTLRERAYYIGSMDDNLAPMKEAQWRNVTEYILLTISEDTGKDVPQDKAEAVLEAYKQGFLSTH